jgi:hypothetical protein
VTVAACSGACGREGLGPFHSGDPAVDGRFTWCDSCWHDLLNKRMPPGLVKDLPPGTMVPFTPPGPPSGPELSALYATEHKIMPGGEVKSVATVATAPGTGSGNGSFTGYICAFAKDHGADTIMGPGAVADTVAALNSGAIQWHLTDSHSDLASDVVASVTAAAVDSRGVRIQAAWMPTERAQALRQMVKAGAQLGLSIDYLVDASRPDPSGGRYLDRITICGGACTPKPMNALATITESKYDASVPVADVYADAQLRHADPDGDRRRREDELLRSVSWPPPGMFDRKTALALLDGAALARSRREAAGDPERAREQARRDQDNAYSYGLAAWMAANR